MLLFLADRCRKVLKSCWIYKLSKPHAWWGFEGLLPDIIDGCFGSWSFLALMIFPDCLLTYPHFLVCWLGLAEGQQGDKQCELCRDIAGGVCVKKPANALERSWCLTDVWNTVSKPQCAHTCLLFLVSQFTVFWVCVSLVFVHPYFNISLYVKWHWEGQRNGVTDRKAAAL